jgi:hypothetical protein
MPSLPSNNRAILAVAGAAKTETVIEDALAHPGRRTLITTYTNRNLDQIVRRIEGRVGAVPSNIRLVPWMSFVLNDGVKPFQHAVLGAIGVVRGVNIERQRDRFDPYSKPMRAYLDSVGNVFSPEVAHFACAANKQSGGAVIERLERIYDAIYVDEVQDLVCEDIDFLELLLKSRIAVTFVGDPRQHILETKRGNRNQKYRGRGFATWVDERATYCAREDRTESYRCNPEICAFASAIFPDLPPMTAAFDLVTGHDGIFEITRKEVHEYVAEHQAAVLRQMVTSRTLGLPAQNIGVAKGSTFDHVVIFMTKAMRDYLKTRDPGVLTEPEKFYVAVTRARHSVAFVSA